MIRAWKEEGVEHIKKEYIHSSMVNEMVFKKNQRWEKTPHKSTQEMYTVAAHINHFISCFPSSANGYINEIYFF